MKKFRFPIPIALLGITAVWTACSGRIGSSNIPFQPEPTPTNHILFSGQMGVDQIDSALQATTIAPTLSDLFGPRPTQTLRPTSTPRPAATPLLPAMPIDYSDPLANVWVYDDELDDGWQVFEPSGMEFDLQATSQVYSGRSSIEAVPKGDFSTMLFAVRPDAQETYPQSQVLAISFQLYSGDSYIRTEDLAVSVLGSNSFPYYVPNDNSVVNTYDPVFSETRLYYLGINRDIPPDTWVDVTLWLDDRVYDPIYSYVTGFYIKNDVDFGQPFWVDEVRLIMNSTG